VGIVFELKVFQWSVEVIWVFGASGGLGFKPLRLKLERESKPMG
jgi:hypothetical protein